MRTTRSGQESGADEQNYVLVNVCILCILSNFYKVNTFHTGNLRCICCTDFAEIIHASATWKLDSFYLDRKDN